MSTSPPARSSGSWSTCSSPRTTRLLTGPGVVRTLFDPACGTGGMLSVAEDHLRSLNPSARLEVFGQELNDETYAICRSDMMLKGQDASHIVCGNSFSEDGHQGQTFDYLLANPPFGVEWKKVEDAVRDEHEKLGLRRSVRCRAAPHQRRQLPVPPAHDLQDEASRGRREPPRHRLQRLARCSPERLARGSPRSGAGSSRTTGSRPSSPCPTSSSTTPASPPTSGSSPTASAPSAGARCSWSTPASTG